MPWKQDTGLFEREVGPGPDIFTGDVWEQDRLAGKKIIAERHDYHDGDLAGGISLTLHVGGFNQMQAELNMGDYRIINLDAPQDNDDGARLADTVTQMDWEPAGSPGLLRLVRPVGNLEVTLPIGAASGTVTSINLGAGLNGANNPITTTGDIDLIDRGITPGDYTSANITVNKYGVIESVSSGTGGGGGGADTINGTQNASGFTLQILDGATQLDDVPLLEVTNSRWGVVTPSQKQGWDSKTEIIVETDTQFGVGLVPGANLTQIVPLYKPDGSAPGVINALVTTTAPTNGDDYVNDPAHPPGYIWFEVDPLP